MPVNSMHKPEERDSVYLVKKSRVQASILANIPHSSKYIPPELLENINQGTYYISAVMEDDELNKFSSVIQSISIESNEEIPVTLRMRKGIKTTINVVDNDNNAITGFQAEITTPDDEQISVLAVFDNQIISHAPLGDLRLKLTKSGETIYNDIIRVTPAQGEVTFETKVVVNPDKNSQ